MDDALDLAEYLPDFFKTPTEQEYMAFLWATFEENYNKARYQFAFLAYHMLMMSFVYFKIWQIRESCPEDFEKGLIGFSRDDDRKALRDASPFTFSKVNERSILQLFKLIGCEESNIGNYKKLVDDRNDTAHANGNIYFRTQSAMDAKIRQVLQAVEEIQFHSEPVISRYYQEFAIQSHNLDEREYPDIEDQIREILIRGNYMSRKDIELCVSFDSASLPHDNKRTIEALQAILCRVYGT